MYPTNVHHDYNNKLYYYKLFYPFFHFSICGYQTQYYYNKIFNINSCRILKLKIELLCCLKTRTKIFQTQIYTKIKG